MNILHVSAQKPDSTGSGIYLSGIINGLRKIVENQVLVAGIDKGDNIDDINNKFEREVEFFPVIYNNDNLDFNVPGMSDNMPYPSTRYRDMDDLMAEKMKIGIKSALEKAVKYMEPDIIVCHHLYYATSIVREMFPNKKVVAICHGTCLRQLNSIDFKKEYIIENIKKLDMIFSLHNEQKKTIEDFFKVPESMVKVLGSGYESSIFYNKKYEKTGPIRISYAGKLSYSKGLIPFISSLSSLDFKKDEIEFVFAGDGSVLEEKKKIIEESEKCKYKIDFIGRVDQYRLSEELNKSDIFVLPSYYEGLPLVLLEAMSCGNYVISTDVDGVQKWIGKEINESSLIEYVTLPKMERVSVPKVEEIPAFEKRLSKSLIKAINYRKKHRYASLNIEGLSWNGLAEKLYSFLKDKLYKKKYAIIDFRMDKSLRAKIEEKGLEIIESYHCKNVLSAISGHVDISMYFDGKNIVVSPDSYDYYKESISESYLNDKGIKLIKGEKKLGKNYPSDILYNACFTGKYVIGNFENTDKVLMDIICNYNNDIEKISVKQGYANCSICVVDEKSVITSDKGLYKILSEKGLDVLLIESGHIELFNMNYGFIGGASGKIENEIIFFGNLDKHPNSFEIKEFIKAKGKKTLSLGSGNLKDFGGICIL